MISVSVTTTKKCLTILLVFQMFLLENHLRQVIVHPIRIPVPGTVHHTILDMEMTVTKNENPVMGHHTTHVCKII